MKKIIYIIFLSLLWMYGCEKNPSEKAPYGPGPRSFAPRDVNYMWISALSGSYLNVSIVTHNQLLDDRNWEECYLSSWMHVDAPIAEVEARSRKRHERFSSISIISIEEQVTYLKEYPGKHPDVIFDGPLYPKLIEYRTEGVADLRITADRPLFGKAAGVSLNEHFAVQLNYEDIDHIPPFSTVDSEEIYFPVEELFGYSANSYDHVKLTTWLARNPTIPERWFWLSTIEPLSEEDKGPVTITVELTTTKGKRFISTQQPHSVPIEGRIYREEFLATRLDE